jgi:hypothetical protein
VSAGLLAIAPLFMSEGYSEGNQRSLNDHPILGRVSTPARLNLFATVLASTPNLSPTPAREAPLSYIARASAKA